MFFQEASGNAPVVDWLRELRRREKKVYAKCVAAIERLAALDRILYFFHGRNVAVLANGLTKEREVPPAEIDRASARKRMFERDPNGHTYEETAENRKPH